jgi:hypothetical protein
VNTNMEAIAWKPNVYHSEILVKHQLFRYTEVSDNIVKKEVDNRMGNKIKGLYRFIKFSEMTYNNNNVIMVIIGCLMTFHKMDPPFA